MMSSFGKYLMYMLAVMASQAMSVNAQQGLRPRGDVNCDWEVTVADINVLVDAIMAGTPYHSFYTYDLDLNDDKEINIADINMAVDAILGGELPPMPTYSSTLPVLFINTEGYRDIVSKEAEDYLHADWWIEDMGLEGCESIGSAQEPLGMLIKGRGNFTWTNIDKKAFRLKFDEKHPVLGMPSNRHWVLLANAEYWMGQMNDALPFEIGRRMGMGWNPHQVPVEVVLNGQYIGMYFLTEQIRVGKERVNITEQNDYEVNPRKVTGGWLLEIDNYYDPNQISFTEGNGWVFWATPHSPEYLSPIQRQYITDFLKAADIAIYNPDKSSVEWEQYIDIDSLALFYVIQEIVDNPESFSGSCYLHKERGENTKLVFGPLWDGGSSYVRYTSDYQFDHFIYDQPPTYVHQRWIAEIAKYPRFQERVCACWDMFYNQVYPTLNRFIDDFVSQIETAGEYDHVRWPQYSGNNIRYRVNVALKPSLRKKVAWLNEQWKSREAMRVDTISINQKRLRD